MVDIVLYLLDDTNAVNHQIYHQLGESGKLLILECLVGLDVSLYMGLRERASGMLYISHVVA